MYRYILRYKIDPEFNAEQRLAELVEFCQESGTKEVMLFFAAEELSPGHITPKECLPYIALAQKAKRTLNQHNIDMSLNPWTTLYQIDRGRTFREGQKFQPIIGETGYVNTVAACPLCPQWQAYLTDLFAWFAREIEPTVIWVEDDWRLHNHDVDSGWGGCFCPRHLERFGEMIGQSVTREDILRNILAPGTPHPWRQQWLELSRQSLLEPAQKLHDAVHNAAPNVRLGLMSSVPDVHSAEGRNWPMLQDAFRGKQPFVSRPHLPPYTEQTGLQSPPSITRQTIACLARPIEIYPELESSPRNGSYSRSGTFAAWQCCNAAMYGSRGITINHFDMMGNGIQLDPSFAGFLGKARPQLDALTELHLDDDNARGVNILFKTDIANAIHSTDPSSMQGLCQDSVAWASVMFALGISHRFTKAVDSSSYPYALCGQTLRACNDNEIEKLLAGSLMLDGASVEIMIERGFGDAIGISSGTWRSLRSTAYAYERILDDNSQRYGLAYPRMSAQRCASAIYEMKTTANAKSLSSICRYDHEVLMPGCVYFENDRGGKIVSLAYPFDHRASLFMDFFSCFRRLFVQDIVGRLAAKQLWAAVANHPANAYCIASGSDLVIGAFNLIPDPADQLTIRVQGLNQCPKIQVLSPDGQWTDESLETTSHDNDIEIKVPGPYNYLDRLFIRLPAVLQ